LESAPYLNNSFNEFLLNSLWYPAGRKVGLALAKRITKQFPRGKPLYLGRKQVIKKTLRDYDIFEMARDGHNCEEIAAFIKKKWPEQAIGAAGVASRLRVIMQNVRTNSIVLIEEYRQMAVAVIDKAMTKATAISQGPGKPELRLRAIDTIMKLQERKARILGLDQQVQKVHVQEEVAVRIYHGLTEDDMNGKVIDVTPERKELNAPTPDVDYPVIGVNSADSAPLQSEG
jgi:hypothetical protein